MARLNLVLLGGFSARLETGEPVTLPTRKTQALLAYLALSLGQAQPRDKLAALLWGDLAQAHARSSVRAAIFALRKSLGRSEALVLDGHDVALDPAAVAVDVKAFEQHIERDTPEALAAATRLYGGDLLAGLSLSEAPFEEWLITERERLRELAMQGLARLLAHHRAAGKVGAAIQAAHALLALDPLQEPVHRTLMRLYTQTGRRATALRQYQHCVSALARELRTEPEAETKALYQEILRRRAAPAVAEEASVPADTAAEAPLGARAAPDIALVGRHAELTFVSGELDGAWAGHGRIVALLGEAGIGKSRLAAELAGLAEQRGGRVLAGHCYETEQGLPFAPWVDAFRAAGVVRDAALLDSLGPVWCGKLTRLLPELPGASAPTGPGEALSLLDAIVQLLERLAARQPVMILLEDVHWADEMSLRLIGFLGRRIAKSRILVVTTLRNDDTANASLRRVLGDELVRERLLQRLTLPPLSRPEMSALVQQLRATDGDTELAERVWHVSEGNPFMAVETVRALADDPMSERQGLSLPEGVRHLVTGRLARLSERGRRLVSLAAAIGRQFDFGLLARAADLSEGDAAEGVEELVRWRILHQAGDGFAFTHDRIREVAYDELIRPRRVLLHRRIAEAIEATAGTSVEAHALAIGTHYREGEVWDKAAAFLQKAGFVAAARASTRDAVTCYEQALSVLARLPDSRAALERESDLRFSLAHAHYVLCEFEPAMEIYRTAEALDERLGDDHRRGHVLAATSYLLDTIGLHEDAVHAGERALTIGGAIADRPLEIWTALGLVRACLARGHHRRAIEHARWVMRAIDGLPHGERFGRASILASVATRTWLAMCLARTGEFVEALALGNDGIRIAETVGGPAETIAAHYALGRVHLGRADFEAAVTIHEKALPLCQTGGMPLYTARFLASLASAYARSARIDEALPLLDQAVTQTRARRIAYEETLILLQLAEALILARRFDDARRIAREALELTRLRGEHGEEAWVLHTLAQLASNDPVDGDQPIALYGESLQLAEHLEMRPLQARCHLGLAAAHQHAGQKTEARDHVLRAVEQFEDMAMSFWLGRAHALLASLG